MAKPFPLEPVESPSILTPYRRIRGLLPSKETREQLDRLRAAESRSMQGQPPVIWDRAQGVNVYDVHGNMWLDFSSGVLVANAGHGHPQIAAAIVEQASKPLLTTYCFPNVPRIRLTQKLVSLAPPKLNKVLLLSTGSETTECALKLMRTHGRRIGGDDKNVIVAFLDSFHGRTLGAQQMGGVLGGRDWIKHRDPDIIHVPFPDGFRNEDTSFQLFERSLADAGVEPDNVAGVITETYQGAGPYFMPNEYAQALRKWCGAHAALLCFDEVQAGFGRCGALWGFELYDVVPDLFCLGKGLSSSLPISAVIGRDDVMDLYGPNEMTSTHSANPICCAAALASIEVIEQEHLAQNAATLGSALREELQAVRDQFSEVIGFAPSQGLVGGLLIVKRGSKEPNYDLAWNVVRCCFHKGLLLFAPVGVGGGCIKIAPPLCIDEAALREGCTVIKDAFQELLRGD